MYAFSLVLQFFFANSDSCARRKMNLGGSSHHQLINRNNLAFAAIDEPSIQRQRQNTQISQGT